MGDEILVVFWNSCLYLANAAGVGLDSFCFPRLIYESKDGSWLIVILLCSSFWVCRLYQDKHCMVQTNIY